MRVNGNGIARPRGARWRNGPAGLCAGVVVAMWIALGVALGIGEAGHGESDIRVAVPVPVVSSPIPVDPPLRGVAHPDPTITSPPENERVAEGLAGPEPGGLAPLPMPSEHSGAGPAWPNRSRFFRLPEERYRGPGQPLIQESWRFRPFSASGVFGFVQGSPLIEDWIRENQGVLGGFQLGWDCDHYWGLETRFAWAVIEVEDSPSAIAAQQAKDDAAGLEDDDPLRNRFDGRRDNNVFFWDAHVLYYPWGDTAWRPFLMVGLGATAVSFVDRTDVTYKDTLFTFPFGAGLKYRLGDFLALRMEVADYMGFGGGSSLELIHNLTVTGGLELRFGGKRRAYWPWNPGRHYW